MTITGLPWQPPDTGGAQLSLVQVPVEAIHRLARGVVAAEDAEQLGEYVTGDACAGLWRMRSEQLVTRPGDAPWVTRAVVVAGIRNPVGLAGFHGPPDAVGMVEVGYRIDPQYRRSGYARQSLETLLAVARAHPEVRVVRATISPDNLASRALIANYRFAEVGEQWDAEDGLELIFEAPAGRV